MREIRRQNRKESVDVNKILEERTKSTENLSREVLDKSLLETAVSPSQVDLQAIQIEYENKIKVLELQVEFAKLKSKSLTKNEEKLLNAIRSEVINQECDVPIMTRSYIGKNYGINEKYLGDSIKSLSKKGLIERSPAKTQNNQSTFSWKILQ